MFALPSIIVVLSIVGIAVVLYFTTRPSDLPQTAVAPFVPRDVSPAEQKAAAAAIAALKCPEAYANDVERAKAFYKYVDYYFTEYPTKSAETVGEYDWDTGRIDFLISHHCKDTLIKFGYDGTSPIDSTVKQELINNVLREAQATSTQYLSVFQNLQSKFKNQP